MVGPLLRLRHGDRVIGSVEADRDDNCGDVALRTHDVATAKLSPSGSVSVRRGAGSTSCSRRGQGPHFSTSPMMTQHHGYTCGESNAWRHANDVAVEPWIAGGKRRARGAPIGAGGPGVTQTTWRSNHGRPRDWPPATRPSSRVAPPGARPRWWPCNKRRQWRASVRRRSRRAGVFVREKSARRKPNKLTAKRKMIRARACASAHDAPRCGG